MKGQKIYLKFKGTKESYEQSYKVGAMWIKNPDQCLFWDYQCCTLGLTEIKDGVACWTILNDIPFFANSTKEQINNFWKEEK